MKKKLITGIVAGMALVALLGVTACDSLGGGEDRVSQQLVQVTRGNLELSVTGNGKIETSREARLTFGSAGKVAEIMVEEGDRVAAGTVLAKLDDSSLELVLNQAQLAVTQAEVVLTQAQLAKTTAEYNLKNTRESEDALELALLNAEIGLDTAQASLDAGIMSVDYTAARAELNKAQAWYDYVLRMTQESTASDVDDWLLALDRAEERVEAAQANYNNVLAGFDSSLVNLKKKQVEAAEMAVEQARKNIDKLNESIELQELQVTATEQTVKQAEQALGLAKRSLDDAQRQLDEAAITAPFDGVVAMVLAKEGDIIPSPSMAPTTIVHMINPDYLELVIDIDEIDIPLVELGQKAVIDLDALPNVSFTGEVTAVYPVPMEVGGIVLYKTRISMDAPEKSGIKVGMSASATIVAESQENVLIVPSRAITRNEAGQTIVKVKQDEEIQERVVVVGLDDGLRAEIVSGVSEGETVVVEVRVKSLSGMGMF